jgi:hypothetical protein
LLGSLGCAVPVYMTLHDIPVQHSTYSVQIDTTVQNSTKMYCIL